MSWRLRSSVFLFLASVSTGFGYNEPWPDTGTLRQQARRPTPVKQPSLEESRRQYEAEFQARGGQEPVPDFIWCQIGAALGRNLSDAYYQYPSVKGRYVRKDSVLIAPSANVYCLAETARSYMCYERGGSFLGHFGVPRLFPLCARDIEPPLGS